MKYFFIYIIIFVSILFQAFSQYNGTGANSKAIKVKSYLKKNGSYVKQHHRTQINSYNLDNYKAKNNYNPYTGKTGNKIYKKPYNSRAKSYRKSSIPRLKSYKPIKSK